MFGLCLSACGARTGLDAPDLDGDDPVHDGGDAGIPPDAEAGLPPLCLNPDPDAGVPATVALSINPQVSVADVLFVIDRTGSMDQEIANIRSLLRTVIVPGLVRAIPDLTLGLVTYGDFPVDPYGSRGDVAFSIDRTMSRDFFSLQGAISNVRAMGGGDNPEAMVESLYQIATGEGLLVPNQMPRIPPSEGCPTPAIGYACFRTRAQPVIVIIADAPSHNGPPTGFVNGYNNQLFQPGATPHTYTQALTALNARLRPKIIGINSGISPFWGREDLSHLARDTGTIGQDGLPLVFDIGTDGAGLSDQVVRAIQRFTAEVRFDVTTRLSNIDGSGAVAWVTAVRPVRANPMGNVTSISTMGFMGVLPGTTLDFAIDIDRSRIVQTDREQRVTIRIEFLADGRPSLGFQDLNIVIPPRGMTCAP